MSDPEPDLPSSPETFAFRSIDEIERAHIKKTAAFTLVLGLGALVLMIFDETFGLGVALGIVAGVIWALAHLASVRRRKTTSPGAAAVSVEQGRVVLPSAPHSDEQVQDVPIDALRAVYLQHRFGRRSIVVEHTPGGFGARGVTRYAAALFANPQAPELLEQTLIARLSADGLDDAIERSQACRDFLGARRSRIPWATLSALVVLAGAFALQSFLGATESSSASFFAQVEQGLRLGAFSRTLVDDGQLFRLVVPAFWHNNGAHLLGNLFAIAVSGSVVEWTLGRTRWSVLVTASAVASFATLALFETTWFGVGASGVPYGLLGALLVVWVRWRRRLPSQVSSVVVAAALAVPLATLVPTLAGAVGDLHAALEAVNLAHVGGSIGGAVVALVLVARPGQERFDLGVGTRVRLAGALCGLLVAASVGWAAYYGQSDAYIEDLNRVVLSGVDRLEGVGDEQRVLLLKGFAHVRTARSSAGQAELEAARELLERAREISPSDEASREALIEVRARLDAL